jgi:predicted nucleic acid-binding protein|tara:strand:+ start:789 stop:1085 length:297 start_codon:yes stop_codon:yes gene_type:complete
MKKRIFLDINVMLDFLGERISFYDSIARVLSFLESNKFKIIVSPISYATVSYFSDFENALQFYNAVESNCDIILTRNAKDFKKATLPVMSPDEFLNSL